ncbi:putative peptide modification system cyclase [Pseudoxanthomonas sp. CAU 1598]|uniref:Peptide modification system cyclase n=1 Tax=Pseudomarimonas arenosa TaxID=2774145 RepID=A0AAW3ZIF7_9GAMM|nr:putative peptide modification system cyclase [Pseudomarimonas arenosa]
MLICDLAESTALIERLGDHRATELIRRHDQLARDTLHRHQGREIDKTDGFLLLFERPIQAVAFALEYQGLLTALGQEVGETLAARVGIHVGEVLTWSNLANDVAKGAKPFEVEGLTKAIAARLMSLARAGQVLLSEAAYHPAMRAATELGGSDELRWVRHGDYRLQGVSRPQCVFEVSRRSGTALGAPIAALKARPVRRWRQPLSLVLLAICGIALLYWSVRPEPAIAFAERDWLVLADLNNQSGDPRFDRALDTAVRIGLEQSPHINLVSPHKLRQTLQLMRQPADARIDRELGSQLTRRSGARALLLPTLAEVSGQLRYTTELVDPLSGTTVYSHFVDASDEAQLLRGIDSALDRVRSDLGESIESIERDTLTLDRLTSGNIDALRDYALAQEAKSRSQMALAGELLNQALKLDPEFAMAMSLQAVLRFMEGDLTGAAAKVDEAKSLSSRLSPWEQNHLDAVSALYSGSADTVTKWRALAARFPDRHSAHHTLSMALAADNAIESALQAIQPALDPISHGYRNSQYQAAVFELWRGRVEAALALFRSAEEAGVAGDISAYALAELASGNAERGLQLLQAGKQAESAEHAARNALAEVSIQIQRGELAAARAGLSALSAQHADLSAELNVEIALALASYDCLIARKPLPPARAEPGASNRGEQQRWRFRQALRQAVALHCADSAPSPALARADDDSLATVLALDWLQAEQRLQAGQARQMLDESAAKLDRNELWLLRHARRRAFELLGDPAGVEREARWLEQHAARSLVEFSEHYAALDLINGLFLQRDHQPRMALHSNEQTSGPPQ